MPRPKGLPKSGGRVKGQPNHATADVKEMARKHGPEAIKMLAQLSLSADSDAAKIAACKELLDRAYGKATQPIAGDDDMPAIRAALVEGMAQGQNPRATAPQIVGRVDPVAGRRTGGVIGLSGPQERTVAKVRAGFASGDPEALKHYLTLTRRDKRFDRSVAKALGEGKTLAGPDAESIELKLGGTDDKAEWTWCTVESSTYERVLALAKEGLKPGDIASELNINKSTVSRHMRKARECGDLTAEGKS